MDTVQVKEEPAAMTKPTSKAALMATIDQEWATLRAAIDAADPSLHEIPGPFGWSIKDVVANITGWELEVVAMLKGQPPHEVMGIDQATYEEGVTDIINAVLHDLHQDQSASEVLARADAVHAEFRDLIDAQPWEAMLRPFQDEDTLPPDEHRVLLLDWVTEATYEHYRVHMRDISVIAGTAAGREATGGTGARPADQPNDASGVASPGD